MAIPQTTQRLTEAEYLGIERAAEFKSQFYDGEMFAMAGGTLRHSLIAANLIQAVGSQLRGRPCRVFTADLRLKVEASGLLTYPDLSVICGLPEFAAGTDDTVVNPTLIVEVLSDSTEAFDRGRKFEHYRRMPALREYLLVSQHEPRIEQYVRREAGRWELQEAAGLDASLALPSLGVTLALAGVFEGVEFSPLPLPATPPPRPI